MRQHSTVAHACNKDNRVGAREFKLGCWEEIERIVQRRLCVQLPLLR